MEGVSLFLLATAAVVFLYYGIKVLHSIWLKPKSMEWELRRQGINGNPYRLLYGDMKEELEMIKETWSKPMEITHSFVPRALPYAHRMVQKYGKHSLIWVGTTPRVIIWDPEMMREILLNKSGLIQRPHMNPFTRLLSMGLSSLEGEEWATRRKMITPAFHLDKLKGMVPAFQTSCTDLVARWEKLIKEKGSCEVDVWPEFQNLTGDVIARTAFGSSFEEGKRIFELQKEQAILVIEASRALYLPGLRFLPTKKNKRRMYVNREIKSMLRDMIDKKLNLMRTEALVNDDLLSLMLESTIDNKVDEQRNSNKISGITIEEIIEECKLFYFAGQETTSVWLTWTVLLLSMHQDWQQRAREEVLEACGKNTPNFEAISHLKIVPMILYEVLRLYPPVVSLFRNTSKRIEMQNFSFPPGVDLLLPTILFHHDPQYWGDDAEEFNPERFSEGVSKASKGQNAFFPFGWGPRICLGMNFAIIEAKMALAMILQHFSFELSPSYAHAPYTVITLQPQFGAQIILHYI